jgi:hypothetical protein
MAGQKAVNGWTFWLTDSGSPVGELRRSWIQFGRRRRSVALTHSGVVEPPAACFVTDSWLVADLIDRGFDVGKFAPYEVDQVDEPTPERVENLAARVERNTRSKPTLRPSGEGPTGKSAPLVDVGHEGRHLTVGERVPHTLGPEERSDVIQVS